jgi:cobalt-zinc-cadmium efflux system outer membrane protein
MVQKLLAAALAASVVAFSCPLVAAGDRECSPVSRRSVVHCALAASLDGRAERQSVEALEGRRVAVSPLLPANPILSVAASRRTAGGAAATNWTASLAQELEIGGQRGTRRAAVDAEIAARKSSVAAVDRDVAAQAWRAYFVALAARDELALTTRLEKTLERVNVATRAAADRGLVSGVESDLADVAELRVTQARARATVRARTAFLTLASLIGFDPTTATASPVEGELIPMASAERVSSGGPPSDIATRPEVQSAEFERRAFELQATAFRRARIPNVTVSAFVENDGFNERVIGAGVALPIPLPSPLGRTYAGEIAENEALSRRAATEVERVRRAIRLERMNALQSYEGAKAQAAAFTSERLARADQGLASIAQEIEAGRLSIRDAIVSQQALVDLLLSAVQARLELCLSSVDLVYAAGLPLRGSDE